MLNQKSFPIRNKVSLSPPRPAPMEESSWTLGWSVGHCGGLGWPLVADEREASRFTRRVSAEQDVTFLTLNLSFESTKTQILLACISETSCVTSGEFEGESRSNFGLQMEKEKMNHYL